MQKNIRHHNIIYFIMHRLAVWNNYINTILQQAYILSSTSICKLSHYCESRSEASAKVSHYCESHREASLNVSHYCESHSEASLNVSHCCESHSETSRSLSQACETISNIQKAFHNMVKAYISIKDELFSYFIFFYSLNLFVTHQQFAMQTWGELQMRHYSYYYLRYFMVV